MDKIYINKKRKSRNPKNSRYHFNLFYMSGFKEGYEPTQDDLDNRSNQLNPNHEEYQGDQED